MFYNSLLRSFHISYLNKSVEQFLSPIFEYLNLKNVILENNDEKHSYLKRKMLIIDLDIEEELMSLVPNLELVSLNSGNISKLISEQSGSKNELKDSSEETKISNFINNYLHDKKNIFDVIILGIPLFDNIINITIFLELAKSALVDKGKLIAFQIDKKSYFQKFKEISQLIKKSNIFQDQQIIPLIKPLQLNNCDDGLVTTNELRGAICQNFDIKFLKKFKCSFYLTVVKNFEDNLDFHNLDSHANKFKLEFCDRLFEKDNLNYEKDLPELVSFFQVEKKSDVLPKIKSKDDEIEIQSSFQLNLTIKGIFDLYNFGKKKILYGNESFVLNIYSPRTVLISISFVIKSFTDSNSITILQGGNELYSKSLYDIDEIKTFISIVEGVNKIYCIMESEKEYYIGNIKMNLF